MSKGIYKTRVGRRQPLTGRVPAPLVRERERLLRGVSPSARDLFPGLRDRMLDSRPVLGVREHPYMRDAKGKPLREPVFGKPTFRNVIADGVLK